MYANGSYENAFYLAGYSVELALKARICKQVGIDGLFAHPKYAKNFKIHDLDTLLMFSGLLSKLSGYDPENEDLHNNWSYICGWKKDSRYFPKRIKSPNDVLLMLTAIDEPNKGFLKWIRKYW